ncbi:IclR family transcriptional regulator C-terminal domain-containing protein [Rugosimonospora acidiphila]|uniref:IclR family transcriptional regulator C-terminal domain-containing protein n=1 Tax=Rugosimonospora acidiphila TaxID=556531 RepID=A0ABP9S2A3_9ACTN
MARETGPDFIEALARGLDVLRCFRPGEPVMTLSEVAAATGLARPTARRILLTLDELGYVRAADRGFALTPRVLDLGMAYVNSLGMWDIARPHMRRLVEQTDESTSVAQLDGSDIVYVARVAVPKIVTLAVTIGTRFPAPATSMGKVLLAALQPAELTDVLANPSRSGIAARWQPERDELDRTLREVRARGWALADQDLAAGIRSVATGVRDGDGRVVAAINVTVHAAETSMEKLTGEHLPRLLSTAADISRDWALRDTVPIIVQESATRHAANRRNTGGATVAGGADPEAPGGTPVRDAVFDPAR